VQSSSQIITTNKPTSSFLQAGCPSCHPTNSVKAPKGKISHSILISPLMPVPCQSTEQWTVYTNAVNTAWPSRPRAINCSWHQVVLDSNTEQWTPEILCVNVPLWKTLNYRQNSTGDIDCNQIFFFWGGRGNIVIDAMWLLQHFVSLKVSTHWEVYSASRHQNFNFQQFAFRSQKLSKHAVHAGMFTFESRLRNLKKPSSVYSP